MDAFDSRSRTVDQKGASIGQEYKIQAQSPVLQKSIYQKLFGYLGPTKYIHPDLHVVIGGESLGVVTYAGSDSKSEIKISLPENTLLQHFTQTQNRTELQALIGNVTTVAQNKGRRGSNQIPNLQSANKSCQTNTDNMCNILFEILKMQQWPDCNNTEDGYSSIKDKIIIEILKMYQWPGFTNTEDEYSSTKGDSEQEGPFYHGLSIDKKSESRKKFVFDGHPSFLKTITFTTDTSFQERDSCMLFYWKSNLYTPSAVRKMIKEKHYEGDNFDIILISEGERQLRIENLSDVVISTAFKVAKSLQNLKDGRLVKKLKEVLHPLESRAEGVQIINVNKPSSTQQKRKTKENNNSRTNFKNKPQQQRTKSIRTGNIDEKYCLSKQEEYYKIVQEEKPIMKNQQKNDLSITDNYFVKPLLERSEPKIPSHKVVPTKMKNSKVKTKINHPEWKINLRPGEDELRNLVCDYFGDDMIRRAVYGLLEHDVDRRCKDSFERPNVPWPSMHPLLPYKLRFLDDDEDQFHTLRDNFTGDVNTQQQDDNSGASEQGDTCERSDISSIEIGDGHHLNTTSTDENDSNCDQSN